MPSFDAAFLRNVDLQEHLELKELLMHPGWYRWWATEHVCRQLLGVHADGLMEHLTQGKADLTDFRLIYVGIAPASKKHTNKPLLKARVLDWHIRQKHSLGNIKHGFLSTFRQSLSALLTGNMASEKETNYVIDQMKVELFPFEGIAEVACVNQWLHEQEATELEEHVIPLNIQGNGRLENQIFKQYLKAARSTAKQAGIRALT